MMHRTSFMSILVVLLAVYPLLAELIKSNTAGNKVKTISSNEHQYTAKDYVQDGLVAMWDGIENVGFEMHDPNTTIWKDLVHGIELEAQYSHIEWNSDSLLVKGKWITQDQNAFGYLQTQFFDAPKAGANCGYTLEIVSKTTSTGSNNLFGQRYVAINIFSYDNKICAWLGNGNNTESSLLVGQKGVASFVIVNNGSTYDHSSYANGILSRQYFGRAYYGELYMLGIFGVGQGQYSSWGIAEGDYYNVRLYSRPLTADEISYNYKIDKARFNIQ